MIKNNNLLSIAFSRQLIGCHDDILDISIIPHLEDLNNEDNDDNDNDDNNNYKVAIISNSSQLKIMDQNFCYKSK